MVDKGREYPPVLGGAGAGYDCWLGFRKLDEPIWHTYRRWCSLIVAPGDTPLQNAALNELQRGIAAMLGVKPPSGGAPEGSGSIIVGRLGQNPLIDENIPEESKGAIGPEGYCLKTATTPDGDLLIITARTDQGLLYGTYALLRLMSARTDLAGLNRIENPRNPLRLIDHWDNLDGSVERGYAGRSIFYCANRLTPDLKRLHDYARLLASIGINGIVINNVNVKDYETRLITPEYLPGLAELAGIFRDFGIRIYFSINYASPIRLGNLAAADPLDPEVREWWARKAAEIYSFIPDCGGFLVKADSEFTPGPFTYGRNHAEGANMLAEALEPFGGLVIWRCFVYNCAQDWRDRTTDRAKAAYDNFKPLDGEFRSNVVLQIKSGPMDFQVREPVSPLLGALTQTNELLELQITQEYTGQQRHLCYLVPQWKEVFDFDTFATGQGATVKQIVSGSLFKRPHAGVAGVANIGDDPNWTGHDLAQANLYGFGRLAWNPDLTAREIAEEWVGLTFGHHPRVMRVITEMLLDSWKIYEMYTAPLGIGWMVNPGHHYGPNVDGYEYSKWGTYHRADCHGIGIDRTRSTGTGFTGQYYEPIAELYESLDKCPDELLLFFHHVPYSHRLKSGETVIQHIYNTHFEGVERVAELRDKWLGLEGLIDEERFTRVLQRLEEQLEHAKEWRDVINSYFYRKSGIADELGRKIY